MTSELRKAAGGAASVVLLLLAARCGSTGSGASGTGSAPPPPPAPPAPARPAVTAETLARLDARMAKMPAMSRGGAKASSISAFWIGKYEVTQAEWKAVMGANPSRVKGDDLPVTNVSFPQAKRFIDRLNAAAGADVYRLPTRREWEYACHAARPGKFPWGNDEAGLGRHAWWGNNSGEEPHPVGAKLPNAWGLYDMIGNASEWTSDTMQPGLRYVEGGSFYEPNASGLWCENTEGLGEDGAEDYQGLRLVRKPKPDAGR